MKHAKDDVRPVDQRLTAERGKVYGHPLDDFTRIAKIKEALSGCQDPQVRHALEMIGVKLCRLTETPDHQDSIDDIKGYAECINMIHKERRVREGSAIPDVQSAKVD